MQKPEGKRYGLGYYFDIVAQAVDAGFFGEMTFVAPYQVPVGEDSCKLQLGDGISILFVTERK